MKTRIAPLCGFCLLWLAGTAFAADFHAKKGCPLWVVSRPSRVAEPVVPLNPPTLRKTFNNVNLTGVTGSLMWAIPRQDVSGIPGFFWGMERHAILGRNQIVAWAINPMVFFTSPVATHRKGV